MNNFRVTNSVIQRIYFCTLYQKSRDSGVAITTGLQTGLPTDLVSISGRDNIFSFSPKHPRHLGGPLSLLSDEYQCRSPGR